MVSVCLTCEEVEEEKKKKEEEELEEEEEQDEKERRRRRSLGQQSLRKKIHVNAQHSHCLTAKYTRRRISSKPLIYTNMIIILVFFVIIFCCIDINGISLLSL